MLLHYLGKFEIRNYALFMHVKESERPIISGNSYWMPVVAALPSGFFLKFISSVTYKG